MQNYKGEKGEKDMPDFTNMDPNQIGKVIDAFKEGIKESLRTLDALKEIHCEDTLTREIIADALAVSKGQTTIEKIRALHERPKIETKSRDVLIHRGHVSEMVILPESKSWGEILGMGTIIPYKFGGSEESTEIFRLTAYHHVGMIAVSEREGIDVVSERESIDIVSERESIEFIYRTKDKVPVGNYFPTKEDDIYGKREINCA